MLFNSPAFIFVFLPVVFAGFYIIAQQRWRWATAWLACASIWFYAWWNVAFLPILIGSILVNYAVSVAILRSVDSHERRADWILAGGILANISLLFTFKYLVASLALVTWVVPSWKTDLSFTLPLGISFFTFTQIGFLVDCRQGMATERNFVRYVLFVTFFPHLIAGPILHHREMMPQFSDERNYRFDVRNVSVGLTLFVMGFFKKVIVADTIATFANVGFSDPGSLSAFGAWEAVLAYSLQLYFDFSGYSDMAIGLARMFGVRFPLNFNSPYKSASIIEFWQRWHMTLSRYLTLYIYNPLTLWVTRRRAALGKKDRRGASTMSGFVSLVAFPLLTTMVLAGVWHGAGFQFLIFGALHGLYLTVNHAWRVFGPKRLNEELKPIYVLVTYIAIAVSWVFFRSNSTSAATLMLTSMMGANGLGLTNNWADLMIVVLLAVAWTMPNSQQILAAFEPALGKIQQSEFGLLRWRPDWIWAVGMGTVFGIGLAVMFGGGESQFLYFRF